MINEVIEAVQKDMEKAIEAMERDFSRMRTGRASLALLDGIRVDYYGSISPLNQVASLSIPESRLITIKPWDKTVIGEIEKAIQRSDLGLTPSNDGQIIRIAIPPLSEERRKEIVKVVHKRAEEGKISIRNARREGNEMLRAMENDGEISEDELHKAMKDVQKQTDDFIKKVDEGLEIKEKEIMEF